MGTTGNLVSKFSRNLLDQRRRSRELLASQDRLDGGEVDLEGPFFQM